MTPLNILIKLATFAMLNVFKNILVYSLYIHYYATRIIEYIDQK
jgi:hypothetical protein